MPADAVSIQFDMRDVQNFTRKLPKAINRAVQYAFNEVMEAVFAESQMLVPVKTGALKASGHLYKHSTSSDLRQAEAAITYGGGTVDYAVYVHENLYDVHAAPTQAKYLEDPMIQHMEHFQKQVRLRVQKVLDTGGSVGVSDNSFTPTELMVDPATWNTSVGFSQNSNDSGMYPSSDSEFRGEM